MDCAARAISMCGRLRRPWSRRFRGEQFPLPLAGGVGGVLRARHWPAAAQFFSGPDAGEGAVLMESPAKVCTGIGNPVVAQRGDGLLGLEGFGCVLRVFV